MHMILSRPKIDVYHYSSMTDFSFYHMNFTEEKSISDGNDKHLDIPSGQT